MVLQSTLLEIRLSLSSRLASEAISVSRYELEA